MGVVMARNFKTFCFHPPPALLPSRQGVKREFPDEHSLDLLMDFLFEMNYERAKLSLIAILNPKSRKGGICYGGEHL